MDADLLPSPAFWNDFGILNCTELNAHAWMSCFRLNKNSLHHTTCPPSLLPCICPPSSLFTPLQWEAGVSAAFRVNSKREQIDWRCWVNCRWPPSLQGSEWMECLVWTTVPRWDERPSLSGQRGRNWQTDVRRNQMNWQTNSEANVEKTKQNNAICSPWNYCWIEIMICSSPSLAAASVHWQREEAMIVAFL